MKNAVGILIGIALNLHIFGYYEHLYKINSSGPWTLYIFLFICVIFKFFNQSPIVFSVQVFHLFDRFIPRYFIIFDTIISGVVFLIFLSEELRKISFFLNKNTTDLYVLICILQLYCIYLFCFFGDIYRVFCVLYVKLLQLCATLCDPMDCSPPGSSVHGILQARILEWVVVSSSRGILLTQGLNSLSYVFYIGRQVLYHEHHLGSLDSFPHIV